MINLSPDLVHIAGKVFDILFLESADGLTLKLQLVFLRTTTTLHVMKEFLFALYWVRFELQDLFADSTRRGRQE